MCSLQEAHEAYQYIGLPGYNPHLKKDIFFKYYDRVEQQHNKFHGTQELLNSSGSQNKLGVEDKHTILCPSTIQVDYRPANKVYQIPNTAVPPASSAWLRNTPDAATSPIKTDKDKILLINSRRVFHIAEEGRNYQEREELARSYFDRVKAVEQSQDINKYINGEILLQIYIVNKANRDKVQQTNLYGFRPVIRNSYMFHRYIKDGYLVGTYADLKKNIDWTYFPLNLPENKDNITFICAASYFKRKERRRLSYELLHQKCVYTPEADYNWPFWPDMD
jgi:hypothetical protein